MKQKLFSLNTKPLRILWLVLIALMMLSAAVFAAQQAELTILSLDTSQYPLITFYLQPDDQQGQPLDQLSPETVRIIEDESTLAATSVEKIEPGVHFILAVNAGPRLKDLAAGKYRFDSMRDFLLAWIQNENSDGSNDYSLTSNTGVLINQNANAIAWAEILRSYQPNFALSQPNLVSLSQAIDLAASPQGAVPKKYSVLYITPLMDAGLRDQLPDIGRRARDLGIQVNVWLVGAGTLRDSNSTQPYQELAAISGGSYFFYSGVEALPNPSDALEKLRYLYRIQYHSQMRSTGIHTLSLSVLDETVWKKSNSLTYQFDVLPPNPIFLSPPSEILRKPIPAESLGQEDTLEPDQVEIQLLVEFPDQYQRALTISRLFANDVLVARNTEAPFDRFTWDLTPYTSTQTVLLKADIQDEAGFSAETIRIPVKITIESRKRTFLELVYDYQSWIISTAVILTLLLLLSAFFTLRGRGSLLTLSAKFRKTKQDPLTQAVDIPQMTPLQNSYIPTLPAREKESQAAALLLRLDDTLQTIDDASIPLPQKTEILLGNQKLRVDIWLDDTSVSPIHARISRDKGGRYSIYDEGSIAGTWLNFAPISSLGAVLRDGDTIQFGRLMYRFQQTHRDLQAEEPDLPYNQDNV